MMLPASARESSVSPSSDSSVTNQKKEPVMPFDRSLTLNPRVRRHEACPSERTVTFLAPGLMANAE